MKIRPKHLQFCMHYLETGDPGVAYKMTYPKAGIKSLYAAASRLMSRPDVSAWIEETRNGMQERLLREIEDAQVQAKKQQLLSINEKRAVLTGLILGETKRTRHIRTKYGVTKVEDDQPVYAILRAIDLDTRLENFQNYLLHRDSFTAPVQQGAKEKFQIPTSNNITPSPLERPGEALLTQVNILIARCEAESVCPPTEGEYLSPAACPQQGWRGGGVRSELVPQSAGGVELPAEDKASPFRGGLEGALVQEPFRKTASFLAVTGDKKLSPAGGGVRLRRTGVELPAQDEAPSLLERAGGEAPFGQDKNSPSPQVERGKGVRYYRPLPYLPLPPKKGPVYLTTGPASSLTPLKKRSEQLTILNNRACKLANAIKNNHLVSNKVPLPPSERVAELQKIVNLSPSPARERAGVR